MKRRDTGTWDEYPDDSRAPWDEPDESTMGIPVEVPAYPEDTDLDLVVERPKKRRRKNKELPHEASVSAAVADPARTSNAQPAPAQTSDAQPAPDNGLDISADGKERRSFADTLVSILSGNILTRSEVTRAYPYMVFVAALALFYIGNIFRSQAIYREHAALQEQVKELRSKSMTIASERMRATRQSRIMIELDRRGIPLVESLTPNKVIPKPNAAPSAARSSAPGPAAGQPPQPLTDGTQTDDR